VIDSSAPDASHGLLDVLARGYGAAALARRRWFDRRGRRRLERPVVSVGNLVVGGTGKTPVVAALAALLRDAGERPSILSRGYRRTRPDDGVVVVRDAERLRADLARSGDEPLMLARQLDGVAVVVGADRYLAGRLAERRLGCTIHVLDDGFQHHDLARDVDLLVVSEADLHRERVLPAGRLREPVEVASRADAWLVSQPERETVASTALRLGVSRLYTLRREQGVPRLVSPCGQPPRVPRSAPVLAVAGIARPGRFFTDLQAGGWNVAGTIAFPDHRPYAARDVARVSREAAALGAELVVTTEKDVVRWLPLRPLPFALAWVPLEVTIEPADELAAWLRHAVARRGEPRS
jgi:tetraacyldisaccharide 4'-kinase